MGDASALGGVLIGIGCSVFLVFCVIILCASSCRRDEFDYTIDMIDGRDLLLRENLADTVMDDGQSEWQCIVCLHLNHPAHEACSLCGAHVEASTLSGTHLLANNSTLLGATMLHAGASASFLLTSSDMPLLRSSSSATDSAVVMKTVDENAVDMETADLAMSVRQRALRYRRLNQMQLNQKQRGASRRRLWQRVPLPNGAFVWVRTTTHAPVLHKSDSLVAKLRNNTFLTKNPQANQLHGEVAEQLHRKNAASMGFFTELNDHGKVAWRKTDSVAIDIDTHDILQDGTVDFEGVLSMSFRDKRRWLLKKVSAVAVPYTEAMFRVDVRRAHVLEDSLAQLGGHIDPARLPEHLNIAFIGEPALDAGGVLREWFGMICKQLFSSEMGLFTTTHAENLSYWINPASGKNQPNHLMHFRFAGRLFGKAILEGLVFEAHMALPLLKHFLGVPITFSDLEFLDEELHKHLSWVRDNDNVDALCITFTVQTDSGEMVELKPGGDDIDVTDENKMEYLALMLRYRMLGSVADQLSAMLSGLYEIIPKSLLTVFDYQELDFFLCGLPTINVKDWQANSKVRHFCSEADSAGIEREIQVVWWFWEVVESFSDEERARLLQFATGSTRVPVEGFKALTSASGFVHPFTIQLIQRGTPPVGLCPRAHTCFNRVDLPLYDSKEELSNYLTLVSVFTFLCCRSGGLLLFVCCFRLSKWRLLVLDSSSECLVCRQPSRVSSIEVVVYNEVGWNRLPHSTCYSMKRFRACTTNSFESC